MGIFDLFCRDSRTKPEHTNQTEFDERTSFKTTSNAPVSVFSPSCYQDVEVIIDAVKAGKTTVVHLTELKTETAIRVLDMLSGAIYALGGGVYEMGKNIFMFSPAGVVVNN